MNKKSKVKVDDPVELKRKIQDELFEETKKMTGKEKRAFYKRQAEAGPLAKFWKEVQSKPSKKSG
jgi:hypothetical protein